ncbi:MAG: CvpA family protein [Bacteroidetes bacterium]|nr:CvpA family protein [Bacteroidota bacterium]HET6245543.1 CvpA family protein [Bacteroidia bacterium]
MNKFDIIVLIPLVWGLYKGFRKGFVIEAASLVGLILATWAGIKFSGYLSELLTVEYGYETEYLPIASFFIIFLAILILIFLSAKLLEGFLKLTMLSTFNKVLGAVFCCFKYALILSVLLFILNAVKEKEPMISEDLRSTSYLYSPLAKISITLVPSLKDYLIEFKENSLKRLNKQE